MTIRTAYRHRRAATTVTFAAVLGLLTAGCTSSEPEQSPGVNWDAVNRALGMPLHIEDGGVHAIEWLRTDLHVVNAGVTLDPGMELVAEADFRETTPGNVVMIGEAALTTEELNAVGPRLEQGGVEITAIHKHLQDETPRLFALHYAAYGDPAPIARTLREALARTGIPLGQSPEVEGDQAPIDLDTTAIDTILGATGEVEHGTYHVRVPVAQKVTETRADVTLPPQMEASTLLMFQPLGGGKVAINGDFAMTADQVNPVIAALRSHDIQVIELHNHMLHESPRLFYLHFWATGDAAILAQGLRAGLDQVRAPRR
ncbi:LppY/LpqO family protein [Nocardia sp. NBC_00403]|uniref:LppY/LpqO family protein n=1 Tax=Nocardia sp. NBC_00403 TaxID=2975990 RepID=UPI002E1EEE1E